LKEEDDDNDEDEKMEGGDKGTSVAKHQKGIAG
jgi:hypothetical protein